MALSFFLILKNIGLHHGSDEKKFDFPTKDTIRTADSVPALINLLKSPLEKKLEDMIEAIEYEYPSPGPIQSPFKELLDVPEQFALLGSKNHQLLDTLREYKIACDFCHLYFSKNVVAARALLLDKKIYFEPARDLLKAMVKMATNQKDIETINLLKESLPNRCSCVIS